ncbi:UNVERIFIED_CONTAM: hypothetical protein GTU68_048372, partial [Idotea baltica]|nr:hypothetical protein [Idotea baltica]
LQKAKWLPDEIKAGLEEKHKTSITKEGYFIVKSDRTRSQQLNLADALDKLRHMIFRCIHVIPPPSYKSLEISRRRQEKATRERLRMKREKSLIKRDRQGLETDL